MWLPILSAQSVKPPTAKVQLPRSSDFEQKTGSLIERFSTSGRTLADPVIELAYKYEVPMAIEYADREATTRPLNLEFHNKSFRGIVEATVKEDPQYRVSFSNGIVDIFSPMARGDVDVGTPVGIRRLVVDGRENAEKCTCSRHSSRSGARRLVRDFHETNL
jgi:hypothetical protein